MNTAHYFQTVLFIRNWNGRWYICRGSILFSLCEIFNASFERLSIVGENHNMGTTVEKIGNLA